jgi:hypothetical protein
MRRIRVNALNAATILLATSLGFAQNAGGASAVESLSVARTVQIVVCLVTSTFGCLANRAIDDAVEEARRNVFDKRQVQVLAIWELVTNVWTVTTAQYVP